MAMEPCIASVGSSGMIAMLAVVSYAGPLAALLPLVVWLVSSATGDSVVLFFDEHDRRGRSLESSTSLELKEGRAEGVEAVADVILDAVFSATWTDVRRGEVKEKSERKGRGWHSYLVFTMCSLPEPGLHDDLGIRDDCVFTSAMSAALLLRLAQSTGA